MSIPSEYKTLSEWSEEFKVEVLDPDGFDRSDPKINERRFSRNEFVKGLIGSTVSFKAGNLFELFGGEF